MQIIWTPKAACAGLLHLLFLFNTVTTYFVAHKYSLAFNAGAENYVQIVGNADAISKVVSCGAAAWDALVLPNHRYTC